MPERDDWKPVPTITITIDKMGLDDFATLAPLLQQWAEQSGGKVMVATASPGLPAAPIWEGEPASPKQIELLKRLAGSNPEEYAAAMEELNAITVRDLNKAQASALIKRLGPS